ncbi:MAG TPA: vanadium-dependent haloperoxidase, partial [Gemmatimonadaceae bacterium]|nr:vanadium-dependent haloperoxidase [Gemmatimonadaceae bacterium]
RGLVAKYSSGAPAAIRGYALVGVAQHNAAANVQERSLHAAISAASVVVLTYLYPTEQTALETQLQQYLAAAGPQAELQEGEAVGRATGNRVVAYAQTDRFFVPWTGTVPVGPGIWFSATPPVGANFGQAKVFFLQSTNQFRPAPHPAFNSPEFVAALAEVRQFSDMRTQAQDSIAKFWNMPAGTYQPPGYWTEEAGRLAIKYGLTERWAARLFARTSMVGFDGIVASHEAKYTYWLLRPTMADPGIKLAIGLPNFPSYPSNHATISAAMADILAHEFPSERARLRALADEAALSRVFGGIHYRFDGTAGLTLGRKIAAWALAHDVELREPIVLR